jgi:hypothetical protein
MTATKTKSDISAKTATLVKKLLKEIRQDPILPQAGRQTRAAGGKFAKQRAEIMKKGLEQLGILEHCIELTQTKVAMLNAYLDSPPPAKSGERRKPK